MPTLPLGFGLQNAHRTSCTPIRPGPGQVDLDHEDMLRHVLPHGEEYPEALSPHLYGDVPCELRHVETAPLFPSRQRVWRAIEPSPIQDGIPHAFVAKHAKVGPADVVAGVLESDPIVRDGHAGRLAEPAALGVKSSVAVIEHEHAAAVHDAALIEEGIAMEDAVVGEGAVVRRAVIGPGAVVEAGALVNGASFVGPRARISTGCEIDFGMRVAPDAVLPAGYVTFRPPA